MSRLISGGQAFQGNGCNSTFVTHLLMKSLLHAIHFEHWKMAHFLKSVFINWNHQISDFLHMYLFAEWKKKISFCYKKYVMNLCSKYVSKKSLQNCSIGKIGVAFSKPFCSKFFLHVLHYVPKPRYLFINAYNEFWISQFYVMVIHNIREFHSR